MRAKSGTQSDFQWHAEETQNGCIQCVKTFIVLLLFWLNCICNQPVNHSMFAILNISITSAYTVSVELAFDPLGCWKGFALKLDIFCSDINVKTFKYFPNREVSFRSITDFYSADTNQMNASGRDERAQSHTEM